MDIPFNALANLVILQSIRSGNLGLLYVTRLIKRNILLDLKLDKNAITSGSL